MNKDPHIVSSLHGDGELDDGQNWEAIMYASMHKVDNLISTVDRNGQQIDGTTEQVMKLAGLKEKFLAFNWEVLEMDGNILDEVIATLQNQKL